jgi:hypothetical protein
MNTGRADGCCPCRSRSGTGGRRRTAPGGEQHAEGSAVCRHGDGPAIGPELEGAQVALCRPSGPRSANSLRLPAPWWRRVRVSLGLGDERRRVLLLTGAQPGGSFVVRWGRVSRWPSWPLVRTHA